MTRLGLTLTFVAALLSSSCSDDGSVTKGSHAPPRARATSQAIINGTVSTKAHDYVVLLTVLKDGKMIPWCTATLIAKNLLITARHCVGEVNADETGIVDFDPVKLAVYTGVDANRSTVDQQPVAHGKKTFNNGTTKFTPDLALVLIDKELDAPIVPVRIEGGAVKGESLEIIGYGITQTGDYPLLRQERKGLTIAKTGPTKTAFFDLSAGEFQFGEAACAGDSGGPAFAATTGALIGIASRVDNGTEPSPSAPAARCMGTTTEDIYTDLTPGKTFIQAAFEAAGTEPWIEGEPSPEEKAAAAAQAAEEAKKKEEADRQAAAAKPDDGCRIARGAVGASSSSSLSRSSSVSFSSMPLSIITPLLAVMIAMAVRRRGRERECD